MYNGLDWEKVFCDSGYCEVKAYSFHLASKTFHMVHLQGGVNFKQITQALSAPFTEHVFIAS